MKTLLGTAGLIGSGKSTIASALAERLRAPMVHIDDFKRGVVDPTALTESIDPPRLRWKYYRLALNQVDYLFAQGARCVVMDEMFHVRHLRDRITAGCKHYGISVRWIEVRCPDDVVERRLAGRPRNGHILSTEQMMLLREKVASEFDPFREGDDCLVVENSGLPDDAVDTALAWVRTR
jgi:predicted kinase